MKRALYSTAALVAVATLLAGCYTDGTVPTGVSSTPVEVATPTVEAVEIVAGAVVTDEQAATINRDSADNAKAYQLADGTWVIVVKDQPVPDAVAADGAGKSAATGLADAAHAEGYHKAMQALEKRYAVETGKRVVHVRYSLEFAAASGRYTMQWTVNQIDDGGLCGDPDTCIGKANAWISAQPDAANWTVLVSAH